MFITDEIRNLKFEAKVTDRESSTISIYANDELIVCMDKKEYVKLANMIEVTENILNDEYLK